MLNFKKNSLLLTAALGFLIACSAPRNNPLDANNPNRKLSNISGKTYTFSLPHRPLPKAQVTYLPDQRLAVTDGQGLFKMVNVKRYNGWLYFTRAGYHADSLYLQWDHSTEWHGDVYLNAMPHLDSLVFYSSLVNRYPSIQILELFVKARISDADKDIDSVFFASRSLGFLTRLSFSTPEKFYEKQHITMAELNIESAEELIGHPFSLIVKDSYGHRDTVSQTEVRRIIRDEVNLKSPLSHEAVSPTPTLRWEPINPGYWFTYTVEVRADVADPPLVWQKSGLPPNTSSVQVDVPLPKQPVNDYIWAVWVIDQFGNRARSKFKSFQVQ